MIREGFFLTRVEVLLEFEQRACACAQKVEVCRVRYVTERAEFRAEANVVRLVARSRLYDDGDELGLRVRAHAANHLVAVHARHHHIGDDQVGLMPFDRGQPFDAIIRRVHLVALVLKGKGEQKPLVRLVVNDEDAEIACHDFCNKTALARALPSCYCAATSKGRFRIRCV